MTVVRLSLSLARALSLPPSSSIFPALDSLGLPPRASQPLPQFTYQRRNFLHIIASRASDLLPTPLFYFVSQSRHNNVLSALLALYFELRAAIKLLSNEASELVGERTCNACTSYNEVLKQLLQASNLSFPCRLDVNMRLNDRVGGDLEDFPA